MRVSIGWHRGSCGLIDRDPKVTGSSLRSGSDCWWGEWITSALSPPSIPWLSCPWARHRTPNCSPGAAALAAHCSGCVFTVCVCVCVCVFTVCVCVCVFSRCVCALGWVKCRVMGHYFLTFLTFKNVKKFSSACKHFWTETWHWHGNLLQFISSVQSVEPDTNTNMNTLKKSGI